MRSLTAKEVGAELGYHEKTIREFTRQGLILHTKCGRSIRYPVEAIAQFRAQFNVIPFYQKSENLRQTVPRN